MMYLYFPDMPHIKGNINNSLFQEQDWSPSSGLLLHSY